MRFKVILALVEDGKTDDIIKAARETGATGCTVINNARGEGLEEKKTFFGLTLDTQRDVILLLVEEHRARRILETISTAGGFDTTPGTGIAFQLDVEDAVGVMHQAQNIAPTLEEEEL
ncbi:MAG: P-II family nitrogen regulator [Candidatus Eisenbacteria bacterium]|uniref:P-II family nitrogen regulator n=1 Tax=Eiseniibacteriota bacterium TaxID=2212470 RepID=A0A7Y2H131_UNCEI|nr:P-II family nitrogen regulator [Candidatus Eisenbacteria bacterium]